ncbi:DUF748 domain-containing protein [Methylophaga sp.]|uniref:DUF748 domain-containing protein n=1 Tax=Methylophaga sp. TaxID=2024840 RepID=UPI003A8EE644
MKSAKNTFLKYRSLLIGVISILMLYTLIGFLLLPWLAERQMVKTLQQRLGVEATVEKIHFNPYTFEASVDKLQLTTEQDEPLAAWDALYLNLQPLHIFTLTLRIEEISLANTELHFRRYTNTDNTLTRLADKWVATAEAKSDTEPKEVSDQDDPLFTLEIGAFDYTDGKILYRDEVPKAEFETVLSPINIHLKDFSTAAGQTAHQDLVINLENDATLTLDGDLSLSPLQLAGQVKLQNFSLQTPYRYLQAQLPFELKQGRLDLQLAYDIDMAGEAAEIDISAIDIDLTDFSIHPSEAADAILQAGTLTVRNGRYSYPQNQLILDEVSVADFKLAATRNNKGKLDWLQLIADMPGQDSESATEETEQPTAEQTGSPFTLQIGKFSYRNGAFAYRDEVPDEPFETVLNPISVQLENFSTEAGQTADVDLLIELENDAKLALSGDLSLSPLQLSGQANLDNFSLQMPYRYFKAQIPVELNDGRLDLQVNYDVDLTDEMPKVNLSAIDLALADISIHQPGESDALLKGGTLAVTNGNYAYPENQLSMENIALDDFKLSASRNKQGELNWLQLMDSLPKSQDEPDQTNQPALQLDIANIEINNTALAVEDQMPTTPANLALMLSANMQDFSLAQDQQMPFTSNIVLESGGDIQIGGDLQLFPAVAVNAEANVNQLSLVPLQAYLSDYAHIDIQDGKVDVIASLVSDQQEPFALQGDLTLVDLQMDNQKLNEKLLSLDSLSVNKVDFSVAEQRVAISEVVVDALYSRVLINENGDTNLALLIKEQPASENPETDTSKSDDSNGYDISLGRVKINDASSQFTDQNLPIVFDANMQKLNGEISGFSSSSKQPVDIELEGQVDEFGLVEINGALNPLNVTGQTNITLAFSNLDLPSMTPYTVKFAGREIAEGKADIDLTYEIVESDLSASNNIVIRDIRLGGRVESPDAMDLPLDLAVSLLKNSDGVIELNIPVSGDINDPQFAIGPVIRGAIGNAIRNIVTAPFRFLGSLIGSDDDPIDSIRFRAGRSDIAPPEQERLLKLVEALSQRPQLALQIPAPFDETADKQALQETAVEQRIESLMNEANSEDQREKQRQKILEQLYTAAGVSPDLQTIQQQLTRTAEEQSEAKLDVLAYNAELKKQLIEVESISDSQLQTLARERQNAVFEFIKQNGKLNADQLQTQDSVSAETDDGWLKMKFDLGTI